MSELKETVSELRDALPKFERVVLNGKGIEITPFKFIQFAEALEIISPALSYINLAELNETSLIAAICSNAKIFVKLVALATGESDEFLATISALEGLKVVKAIIKLNADFFVEEVPNLLKDLFPSSPENQQN